MARKRSRSSANSGGSKSSRPKSSSTSRPSRTLSSSVSGSKSSSKSSSNIRRSGSTTPNRTVSTATDAQAQRLSAVQNDWQRVAGTLALASLFDVLDDVTGDLNNLSQKLADVRARGYRFGRDWETQLGSLNDRWPQQRSQATRLLQNEQRTLQRGASDIDTLLQRAARNASLIPTAESRIRALESSARSAETRVRQTFDATTQQADTLLQEINKAQFVLDALDASSFDLLPDEHAIAACRSIWVSDQQEPEGFLFLTDARLIFEQRQEIAKKKILFITTQKELIQEKLWESPIGAVEELEAEDQKAFLKRKEMLTIRFSERTREIPGDITLQLQGTDNETWRSLIRRAKSGQIDGDRFGAPAPDEQLSAQLEQESTEPEKELPTVCPSCNAPLPPIFKGMSQVTCEYCGATTNI